MGFFTAEQVQELSISSIEGITASTELQSASKRLQELHEKLFAQIKLLDLDLNLISPQAAAVVASSVSTHVDGGALCVTYLRQRTQAVTVERLMGREEVASVHTIDSHRHPVIELRLGSDGLALELILSPDAWWDQQNLVGKISITRHQQEFQALLQELSVQYCMGFWEGTHLSEMHLTANQFQHPRIMSEWMSTFQPSADWWRIGVWFDYDDDALAVETIVNTLLQEVRALYGLYTYICWASDNNFRDFYLNSQ